MCTPCRLVNVFFVLIKQSLFFFNQQMRSIKYNKTQTIKHNSWQVSNCYTFRYLDAILRESSRINEYKFTEGETVSTVLDKDGIHIYWLRHCCLSAFNHIFCANWHSSATLTEVSLCFFLRQMPGYNSQRLGTARTLPN